MTALTGDPANNNLLLQKYVDHSNRRATDKYWLILFSLVFTTWIDSEIYLHPKINPNNSLATNISPELTDNIVAHKIDPDTINTNTNNTYEHVSSYWGKNWIFDAITFNVGFLDTNYQRSGPIVLWANVLFCFGLILYGLASMPLDDIFYNKIQYFDRPLLAFLFYYRFLMYLPHRSDVMSLIPYDKNITFWILPELVYFLVRSARSKSDRKDDKDNNDEKISFDKFMGYVGWIGIPLIAFLEILLWTTTAQIHQLGWDNRLFYVFAVGNCYLGITFFYFGLMVISCATSISFDKQSTSLRDLLRAVLIVGKYNFGTACYHATIIFPRIRATFVVNESEFRMIPESTIAQRFCVTHCKIYNLSPILTAVSGRNHSESLRELLRLSNADSSKVKQFQGFAKVSKTFSAIIIGANTLILIMLWAHGAAIDSGFMMGTWMMYLTVLFFNYIFMRAHDAVADTIWLHVNSKVVVKF